MLCPGKCERHLEMGLLMALVQVCTQQHSGSVWLWHLILTQFEQGHPARNKEQLGEGVRHKGRV